MLRGTVRKTIYLSMFLCVYFREQFYFVTFGPYNLKSCFMDEEIIFMKNNRYFRILHPKILEKFGHF